MDWLPEYIKAWSRHDIHFGISCGFRTLRRNTLLPGYFDCLRRHNVAYVMNGGVVFTTEVGVMMSENKLNVVDSVPKALDEKKSLYIYSNGELVLVELMEMLNEDLKSLSPIKKTRAA